MDMQALSSPINASGAAATAVTLDKLWLSYDGAHVLRGIDVTLKRGQTLALLGPSGCGKTTLLRIVAGMLAPSSGEVSIEGQVVAGRRVFVPPEKRGLGMVFQDYALWPHMTVADNVAFPLRMQGVGQTACAARVSTALDRVGLADLAQRSPSALSGGQQQRVAIARAIVAEPRIVLFDEPLSNLDRELRETMVVELGRLIRSLGLTAIYVTHDQSEALTLADQVAVMEGGRIAQIAPPEDLVEHPASVSVAAFLRLGTLLRLTRTQDGWSLGGSPIIEPVAPDITECTVLVTPRALELTPPEGAPLIATVEATQYRDGLYAASVRLGDAVFQVPTHIRPRIGERVGLKLSSDQLRWFPEQPVPSFP